MNTVVEIVPVIRPAEVREAVEWLERHLDLPPGRASDEEARAWLDVPARGIAVVSTECSPLPVGAGGAEAVLQVNVAHLAPAVERCRHAGAEVLHAPAAARGARWAAVRIPAGLTIWLHEPPAAVEADAVHGGPVHFTVGRAFDGEAGEVFRALTSADVLARTHVRRASADLTAGGAVEWWWNERASSRLEVESVDDQAVTFHWHAHRVAYRTRVRIQVADTPRGCRGSITERGWDADPSGLASAFAHSEAWTTLLLSTHLYLSHGLEMGSRALR